VGYSSLEGIHWAAQSLAEDVNGEAIDVRNCSSGSMFLVWASAAATDAVVKLQESNDGTNWKDIASQTVTIAAPTGTHVFKLTRDVLLCAYVRPVIIDNTESAGSASLKYLFKGDR
jgi:hypothetical protein